MIEFIKNNNDDDDLDSRYIDLTGRPMPENVRVQLNSGIELPCEVVYDGMVHQDESAYRRYKITAEIDWSKHWVKTLVVGELPIDVRLIFDVENATGSECQQRARTMEVIVEGYV